MRTGTANLPLHDGKCPAWLFPRMVKLAGAVSEAVIDEYGSEEFLKRLSNPFWFQALGCVIGYDWHSSGITTTTCGALKEALKKTNLGISAAGGKGKTSKKVPDELMQSDLSTQKIKSLQRASKLAAKVDNAVLQDGHQLYHHSFFFTETGKWAIVQQGMNDFTGYARRYHWLSDALAEKENGGNGNFANEPFVNEPHTAICCDGTNEALDLTARQSAEARKVSLELAKDNPQHIFKYFSRCKQTTLPAFLGNKEKELHMPAHHWIRDIDLTEKDKLILRKAYDFQPEKYEDLILLQGMGPKKIRALALIAHLVYGTELSWKDPVKYSFAHGGKDGTPHPVDKPTFDHSIHTLREAVEQARLGDEEKINAMKRLERATL